jgi:hypothetical protein
VLWHACRGIQPFSANCDRQTCITSNTKLAVPNTAARQETSPASARAGEPTPEYGPQCQTQVDPRSRCSNGVSYRNRSREGLGKQRKFAIYASSMSTDTARTVDGSQHIARSSRMAFITTSQKQNDKHRNVYLKVNLGASTGLWGYICFARRRRRYDGRYQNHEKSTDLASNKRAKATQTMQSYGRNMDEDEDGYAVIATRYHLFSEVEMVRVFLL